MEAAAAMSEPNKRHTRARTEVDWDGARNQVTLDWCHLWEQQQEQINYDCLMHEEDKLMYSRGRAE